jgi:hypothetical protein
MLSGPHRIGIGSSSQDKTNELIIDSNHCAHESISSEYVTGDVNFHFYGLLSAMQSRSRRQLCEVRMILNRRTFIASVAAVSAQTVSRTYGEMGVMDDGVFELRQYTLYGGRRDTLISIFEQNFIEPQDAAGAHVYGTFRDLDDPDRFVWIRGFQDMPARQRALEAFYGGPVWKTHKSDANATMVDSDNVLLLRPSSHGQGLPLHQLEQNADGVYGATIYYIGDVDSVQFADFFDRTVFPLISAAGVHPIARFVTEELPNNFPRLPVRDHDRVFLWLARWTSLKEHDEFLAHFRSLSGWRDSAPASVLPALTRKPEQLRLIPTNRSPMR